MGQRAQKVAEVFKEEISQIIRNELHDPRIGFITITHVEITDDLRFARIYYSIFGSDKDKDEAAKALKSGEGFIRKLIGQRVRLKFVPEIRFILDTSAEHSINVQRILDKIAEKKNEADR